jgi:Domain of Unknown Function (DUF1080)
MFRCLLLLAGCTSVASAQWTLDDKLKILKDADKVDVKSTEAPKDAVSLFDGKSLDGWTKSDGKTKPEWELKDGVISVTKGKGDIITKEKFSGSFTLHVEFRIPYEPELKAGQGRGNSGVYLQGRYEVQVLDSYGLKSGKNDCASIYDIHAPTENVCKAPTVWQSYDIEFTAPKFDEKDRKKKLEPVRMTVFHNGVKVQDNVKVEKDNTTSGLGGDPSSPGPILLQEHGHAVQYRNIWLLQGK